MRFDVAGEAKDSRNYRIPAVLKPNLHVMNLKETDAANRNNPERLELERKHGMWTINGTTWHDVEASKFSKVLARPKPNEVQVWELVNKSKGWFHPLHIHLVDFKMLSREDGDVDGIFPYERGPKDTVYLGEGETIRVVAKFGPHRGKYMVHCHNLVHEDHDMMGQFEVGSGGDPWNSDGAKPIRDLKPLSRVRFKG